MEKYYKFTISLNVQKEYKEKFIHEQLIPSLQKFRGTFVGNKCFFHRTVNVGPVIIIYINSSESRASLLYSELSKKLYDYYEEYHDVFKENPVYLNNKDNIKIMNRLKNQNKEYHNFTIMMDNINSIERNGEYYSEDAKTVVNCWLLNNAALMEDTYCLLKQYTDVERQMFLVYLFLLCSEQLDGKTYQGYLSFKSHYIGFMNIRKNEMQKYNQMFEAYFKKHNDAFICVKEAKENHQFMLPGLQESENIIHRWENGIAAFMINQKGLEKKIRFSNIISMITFRKYSSFHKEAFKITNLNFFMSQQFQEYRLLINMIYLILPNIGFNTVKRLQASHALIEIIEKGAQFNELSV